MTQASTPPRKNPALKLIGCLIKVPLGCLGFVVGGAAMTLLFLPPSLGKLLKDEMVAEFNAKHAGSIELEELWIGSLYNDQRLEGIALHDPEGELILRGSARAPDLWEIFSGEDKPIGPIQFKLEQLNLVQDAEGLTNLERAFVCIDEESETQKGFTVSAGHGANNWNAKTPRTVIIEVSVRRIRWQREGQAALELEDFAMAIDLKRDGKQRRLDAKGQVHLAGAGGEPIQFQWHVDDVHKSGQSPWRSIFTGEAVPMAALGSFFGDMGELAALTGPEVDSMSFQLYGEQPSEKHIELLLQDEGNRLNLRARWDRESGILVADGPKLGASLALQRNSALAKMAMGSAMPLGEGFDMGPGSEALWVHFKDFELPLDGDFNRLQANCTFEARDVSFAYLERLRHEFKLVGRERLEEALHLSLRNGILIFDGLNLPAKAANLQLDGGLNLLDGQRHLLIRYKHFPELSLDGQRVWGQWDEQQD